MKLCIFIVLNFHHLLMLSTFKTLLSDYLEIHNGLLTVFTPLTIYSRIPKLIPFFWTLTFYPLNHISLSHTLFKPVVTTFYSQVPCDQFFNIPQMSEITWNKSFCARIVFWIGQQSGARNFSGSQGTWIRIRGLQNLIQMYNWREIARIVHLWLQVMRSSTHETITKTTWTNHTRFQCLWVPLHCIVRVKIRRAEVETQEVR